MYNGERRPLTVTVMCAESPHLYQEIPAPVEFASSILLPEFLVEHSFCEYGNNAL